MTEVLAMLVRIRPAAALLLGLLIAAAATIHVLLTKRDVRAAAGWIGLVWIAPFLGGPSYLLLGINRARRRARRMQGGAASGPRDAPHAGGEDLLDPLGRGIGVITGLPRQAGNAIEVLHNGDAAYPAMLDAVGRAQASIGLSTYIMRDDTTGRRFVTALQAAKARGVEVRVIVDGIGSGWIISPAFRRLRRAGIPAERFMHSAMPWRMPFLNLRTHRKVLVVDGAVAFTGGINIADQNLAATIPADRVLDTHFRLRGPIVAQLTGTFAQDWAFAAGEALDGPKWFPEPRPVGAAVARVITSGPDQDLEKIEFSMLQAVDCARKSIAVLTPYFLPDQPLMIALSLAAMRGVAVDVVIPEHGNHRLIEWAMREHVGPLLHDGVRVWRSPPPFRHSKIMVVDGAWSLVGSSNWDMRSLRLNFELCVEVCDDDLAKELAQFVAHLRGRAVNADDPARRYLAPRLRDAAARLLLPYL